MDGSTHITPLRPGKYIPNHPEVLAEIAADYNGNREGWEHDNTIACECCEERFYTGSGDVSMFDAEIKDRDGVFVCEGCAPQYIEDGSYDPVREHSTLYARGGSVVG
jgi:hypothetical protein